MLGLDWYRYRVSGIGRYHGIGQVSVSGKKRADTDTLNHLYFACLFSFAGDRYSDSTLLINYNFADEKL